MALNSTDKSRLQTNIARDRAEALLEGLVEVREHARRQYREAVSESKRIFRADPTILLDRAIDSTRVLIDRLNNAMSITDDPDQAHTLAMLDEATRQLDELPSLNSIFKPGEDGDQHDTRREAA